MIEILKNLCQVKGGAVEMKLLSIPVGVSDFEEIRRNGYYYVDKSGLIGELLSTTGTKVTLITRPRRFGKTLGMSMLESFFDIRKDNKALFEELEIAKRHELCMEWMNQWPTVFVSFRQVDGLNFNSAYDMLTLVISELYKKHLYLLDSDKLDSFDKEIVKQLIQGTASAKDMKGSLMLAYEIDVSAIWQTCDSPRLTNMMFLWQRQTAMATMRRC